MSDLDKNIFSINSLLIKNAEYVRLIKSILDGVSPKSFDYESYIVDTNFGNKIIKASIVPPNVSKIALRNIENLRHKIEENNVIIESLIKDFPAVEYTNSDLANMLIQENLLDGVILKIGDGAFEVELADGEIILLER